MIYFYGYLIIGFVCAVIYECFWDKPNEALRPVNLLAWPITIVSGITELVVKICRPLVDKHIKRT